MNLSSCGLDCDACAIGKEKDCPGCHATKGNPFWGDCDLYACAAEKTLTHCGKCGKFPCDMLREWASQEGVERIDNLWGLISGDL